MVDEDVVESGDGGVDVHGDGDTLAGGESVGLDDDGGAVFAHVGDGVFEVVEGAVLGGGDVVAGHQLLGEVFGAFDLGGGLVGAEGLMPAAAKSSTSPSIRGTSGPTNAQSYWLCCMKLMKAAWFDSLIWVVRMPSSSMPGLPERR